MVRKAVSRVIRRDAEIQKFISRHLKTETRNMNNANRVCDVQIIDYKITDYQQKHAVLELTKGLQIEASFVEFLISEEMDAMRCFSATKQLSHHSILTPIFLGYDSEKDRILLFYERYDSLLADWREGHEIWWQQATCEQIRATKYLHDKGFIHTGLNDPRNFAIQDNKLKMLNITSSSQEYLQAHPQANVETIKRDNFRSLRDLMRQRYQEKKALTQDDEAFFNLFDRDDMDYKVYAQKLMDHPYAKDFRQCMWEFHDLHLLEEQKLLDEPLDVVTRRPTFNKYRGWLRKIRESNARHLKKALPDGAGKGLHPKFREDDVDTLVKFLRNTNEHRGQEQDRMSVDKYFQAVYKEVKRLFPGLLSTLHQEIRRKKPDS